MNNAIRGVPNISTAAARGLRRPWQHAFRPAALRLASLGIAILIVNAPLWAANAVKTAKAAPAKAPDALVDENTPAPAEASDATGSETQRAADSSPLLKDAAAVLAGAYAGLDTAALLAAIQEKAKWGEIPERLLEAQGILLFNRGDWQLAAACMRRLAKPGPQALAVLAEGALRKGDRYEAAARFLEAARACPPEDARAAGYYRKYLGFKPADAVVEAELAARLEKQGSYGEAALLRIKDPKRSAADPASALRVGAMLQSQGHAREAVELYRLAIGKHPADKGLRLALASACEASGRRVEAGQAYLDAWAMDPSDQGPRDRALAHFEASGAAAEKPLRALLEKAVALDGASHRLRFKLAVACLASGNRAQAHVHLSEALRAEPRNPTYLSRLAETVEGDSLIQAYFPLLRTEFEQRGGSARLVSLAARGYTLAGMAAEAGRAWFQLYTMAPQDMEGNREAALCLAASGDPAYLSVAGRLAAPMSAKAPGDRELGRILLKALVQDGRHEEASAQARRLLKTFPDEAGEALAAAKTMLSMEKPAAAKAVLADIVRDRPVPEASLLLGGILHGEQDCPAAVDHLEAASEAFPKAWRQLGDCLESLGEPLRASLAYRTYYDRTGDKEGLQAMARVDRAVGDPAREKETLDALAAKGLANDEEKLRLGFVQASLGDTAKAAALFEELYRNRTKVPSEPAWVDAGLILGARLAAEGKHDRAIRALSIALRADASRAAAWRLLGDCQVARHQWKLAAASYAGAESAGGASLELARLQVEVARKLDSRKDLAKAYGSLVAKDPTHREAQEFLAAWHQGERNYLDAAHHYRMLTKTRPQDAKAWENLGNCLAMIPDLGAASEALQKAIDLGAESDEVYLNRARAYRQEGAKDMAASILEFLVNRNPRSYLALMWSAKFAEEDGKPDLAMDLFKKASRQNPPKTAWPELASQGVTSASVGSASRAP